MNRPTPTQPLPPRAGTSWLAYLFAVLGVLLFGSGVSLALLYISEAVIGRLGEPDQGMLFWYLPILFLGACLAAGGIALIALGVTRVRRQQD